MSSCVYMCTRCVEDVLCPIDHDSQKLEMIQYMSSVEGKNCDMLIQLDTIKE
jgi:hypothetical protein